MPKFLSYPRFFKKIFDLFLSFLILLIVWPLFLVIAVLIKVTSSGPAIFKQKRVGKNGKVFTLFKFRTMRQEAEVLKKKYLEFNEADGPVFKIRNDPRFINGLGKFLARSGLDELPNIFNVLKGELSWVGPRPLPINETKKINPQIRKIRESILPGITSLWVVSGAHHLKFNQWMKLDQDYIKGISFFKDLEILFKTLIICLRSIRALLF